MRGKRLVTDQVAQKAAARGSKQHCSLHDVGSCRHLKLNQPTHQALS